MCQCSYRKTVSHLCSFNLPSAVLQQQVYVYVFLTSRVQAFHSPPITPTRTSPPNNQGDSSFLYQIPGLSCPICGLNCSLPRENIHMLNLVLPLNPLPGAQVPICSWFIFPSYLIMCVSFLQPCLYRSPSLSFQFSVRILPHGDVFVLCLWREVSSTSSYWTILISLYGSGEYLHTYANTHILTFPVHKYGNEIYQTWTGTTYNSEELNF